MFSLKQLLFLCYLVVALCEQVEVEADGRTGSVESDCGALVMEAVVPLRAQVEGLEQQLSQSQQIRAQLEDEKRALLEDVEQLRKSLDQSRQQVAEHERLLEDTRRELSETAGKHSEAAALAATLRDELDAARKEIEELNSMGLAQQVQQELAAMWEALKALVKKLVK